MSGKLTCGLNQSAASFCKVVLEYSHTHLFVYDCFHITLAKLNTTETAGPIQKKFADL